MRALFALEVLVLDGSDEVALVAGIPTLCLTSIPLRKPPPTQKYRILISVWVRWVTLAFLFLDRQSARSLRRYHNCCYYCCSLRR